LISEIFYSIIIFPIKELIELCFMIFVRFFNAGAALIGVSAAVTAGTLPLYLIAEKWQKTERDIQQRLKPKITKVNNHHPRWWLEWGL
jgi:hypothetical protein